METALGLSLEDALRELLPEDHATEKEAIAGILDKLLLHTMHTYATELQKAEADRKKAEAAAERERVVAEAIALGVEPPKPKPKPKYVKKRTMQSAFQVTGTMEEYKCYLDNWEIDLVETRVESLGRPLNYATPNFRTIMHKVERSKTSSTAE
ncbi:hypothetical protein ACHHYP_16603 [Achlya hypogyna]|uniref:Uncharacterized protein n=1 Tax=Achlya hypogyna TaxID=1202772 RepID=A0A1V9Y6D5_ACHHY|nr:hypothetical protein ACHHYP_16603 [Achlya hypogyna]